MFKTKILFMVALAAIVGFSATSCKKRPGAGARGGDSHLADVRGVGIGDVYADGLGPRFGEDGEYITGQFSAVYYGYDSSQIAPTERSKLEEVASFMSRDQQARLIVEGHCDERGSREYNLSLGERRALAARAYLIGLGVDGHRVQTKSYGSERPAVFGHNEEAWRQNRRAEFVITR